MKVASWMSLFNSFSPCLESSSEVCTQLSDTQSFGRSLLEISRRILKSWLLRVKHGCSKSSKGHESSQSSVLRPASAPSADIPVWLPQKSLWGSCVILVQMSCSSLQPSVVKSAMVTADLWSKRFGCHQFLSPQHRDSWKFVVGVCYWCVAFWGANRSFMLSHSAVSRTIVLFVQVLCKSCLQTDRSVLQEKLCKTIQFAEPLTAFQMDCSLLPDKTWEIISHGKLL